MVTKKEQSAQVVTPKTALLIVLSFIAIGFMAFAASSALKNSTSNTSFSQINANRSGAINNRLGVGSTSPIITGAPGANAVMH